MNGGSCTFKILFIITFYLVQIFDHMENSLEKQSEIHSASENEISLKERCKSIVLGLFIGDALGATSEFQIPWYSIILLSNYN